MRKSMKKLLVAAFMLAAFFALVPSVEAKAYGITQTNPSKNSITVTWEAKNDAINYSVYVGEDYSSLALVATLPATATSYTVTNLPAGCERCVQVKYTYKRTYSDTVYESSVGSEYNLRTIPDKIQNVRQEKWWYFIKTFDVTWDDQEAIDSYEYIIYKNTGKKLQSGKTTGIKCSSTKKISNTMVYKVKVRGTSTICGQTYTTPWSSYAYCFTQPRIKSVKVSGNKLTVKWDKINGATSYDVYVSTKKTTGYKKVATVGKSKSSATIKKFKGKKFKSSKTYYVYVAAAKKVGKKRYDSGRLYYWNSKSSGYGYF